MVLFAYGDLWIYNAHAKLLLLSVSVIEKPSVTAVSTLKKSQSAGSPKIKITR